MLLASIFLSVTFLGGEVCGNRVGKECTEGMVVFDRVLCAVTVGNEIYRFGLEVVVKLVDGMACKFVTGVSGLRKVDWFGVHL